MRRRGEEAFKNLSAFDSAVRKILLAQSLVGDADIKNALGQHHNEEENLLCVLEKSGLLTSAQVEAVTTSYKADLVADGKRLGEIAIQKLMISQEQLNQALEIQSGEDSPIAIEEILVEQKFITPAQRDALVKSGNTAVETLKSAVSVDNFRELTDKAKSLPRRTLIGASVLGLVLVIACLAFLLRGKPDIAATCTMNGYGQGQCSFTNRGSVGSLCGYMTGKCDAGGFAMSETICSGKIEENETKIVKFTSPNFGKMYNKYSRGQDWRDVCGFFWKDDQK